MVKEVRFAMKWHTHDSVREAEAVLLIALFMLLDCSAKYYS